MEVANVITAFASVATAVIAGLALYTWKREFIGKKKIELAAEIMLAACELQDVYIHARIPAISKDEIDEAHKWIKAEKESHPTNADVYPERLQYLVPHRRLEQQREVLDRFRSLQNQAYIYWGKEIMSAFLKLTSYNLIILQASKDLYYGKDTPEYEHLHDIIFYKMKDGQIVSGDKISTDINNVVEEFRRILEPLYMDKRVVWKTDGAEK